MLADTVPIYAALRVALRRHRVVGRPDLHPVRHLVDGGHRGRGPARGAGRPVLPPGGAGGVRRAAGGRLRALDHRPRLPGFAAGFVLWGLGGAFGVGRPRGAALRRHGHGGAPRRTIPGSTAGSPPSGSCRRSRRRWRPPCCSPPAATSSWGGSAWPAAWPRRRSPPACPTPGRRRTEPDGGGRTRRGDEAGDGSADPTPSPATWPCCAPAWSRRPAIRRVRAAVVAVALLGGLDGLEEYFPLLAQDWGVSTSLVPLAVLGIPLVGAAGAALGGRPAGSGPAPSPCCWRRRWSCSAPPASSAGRSAWPGSPSPTACTSWSWSSPTPGCRRRIEGPSRATVTSVASLGTDLTAVALYAAWALDQPVLVAGIGLAMAAALPRLLRALGSVRRRRPTRSRRRIGPTTNPSE